VGDVVLGEEFAEFVLEGEGFVVFLLVLDVGDGGGEVVVGKAEPAVAGLPCEVGVAVFGHPFRGAAFEFSDNATKVVVELGFDFGGNERSAVFS